MGKAWNWQRRLTCEYSERSVIADIGDLLLISAKARLNADDWNRNKPDDRHSEDERQQRVGLRQSALRVHRRKAASGIQIPGSGQSAVSTLGTVQRLFRQ